MMSVLSYFFGESIMQERENKINNFENKILFKVMEQ